MNSHSIKCVLLFCLGLSFHSIYADKIYLKSGEVISGKLMERRESWNPAHSYCNDANDIVIWDDGTYRCYAKEEIIRVEKEFRKPEGLALLAIENNWGEPNDGYTTQLICQNKTYVVGKQMNFGLVLKNISNSVKWYDHQAISHNSLKITGPDANEVYYKKGPFQTAGSEHPLDTNEIATLFENRNIADDYVITQPGKYHIQFREGNYGMSIDSTFPASNIVDFEVKPGSPKDEDLVISSLIDILPNSRWVLARSWNPSAEIPAGRKKVEKSILCNIFRLAALKKDIITVSIWVTSIPSKVSEQTEVASISEYLGESSLGYVYVSIPHQAEDYWATIRQDIADSLQIKK